VKKAFKIFLFFLFFWSCATYQPPPPSLYIESLPASIVAELSLEQRILAEDAWETLNRGVGKKAEKQISRLGAENPIYNVGLAYAYFLQNRLQKAEEFFKIALKNFPDMILIHSGLAQIYQAKGQDERAFAEYREILKREPAHPWAKQQYEVLKNKKYEESLMEAKAAMAAGDKEGSKEAYLKALYYAPQSTEVHLILADIYKKENKLQNALVHLQAASSSEPENKGILKDYAEALYQAAQYTKSLEIYEKINGLEPQNKEIVNRIEGIKKRLGIYELPTKYDSIALSEAVSKEEIAALLAVKFKGILDEVPGTPPIIIDIATSWASQFILQVTSLGIMDIYSNHTFQPKKIVTRAEMAEILLRLINYLKKKGYKFIQQIPPEKIQMSDVASHNYYYQAIVQILSYNIMDLSLEKEFNPDLPLSGQESIRLLDIILALIK
jgi:Tfp pilus assembly protein PilF